MASDPLYAKAGVLDEGKPIDRNLHTATFGAFAGFRRLREATYWEDYSVLLKQILEWLEGRSPGGPEITDISHALRALSERRTSRVAGRLRSCREGASETQHLTSYPHGGYPPVPVEVSQAIKGGLSGSRNPALTDERLLKVFAHPVDACTVEWLMLARFNGGILPGLAGETSTIDPNGGGAPLPFDHSCGPLVETALHLIGHLASGMPVDGMAPFLAAEESPPASAEGSVVDLSGSGGDTTSDGEGVVAATTATVAGARLMSLYALNLRLRGAAAQTPVQGPPAEGVALNGFFPSMTQNPWPGRVSPPMMLVLGTHVDPSIYLLMEIKYPIPEGAEPSLVDVGYKAGRRGVGECHQAFIDVYVAYASKEEAALHARGCSEGPAQGEDGPHADVGFVGVPEPLEPIRAHLHRPPSGDDPEEARPSEVAMDADRRGAAALYLPQCEACLANALAAALGADGVGTAPPPATAAPRRLPRRQVSLLKGEAGEWASYDGGRARVRCVLAIVSHGTGAPDPRSAREVVAAFTEVLAGDSPTPEETAFLAAPDSGWPEARATRENPDRCPRSPLCPHGRRHQVALRARGGAVPAPSAGEPEGARHPRPARGLRSDPPPGPTGTETHE